MDVKIQSIRVSDCVLSEEGIGSIRYEGVRDESKLATFLTSDLLTFYATGIFDTIISEGEYDYTINEKSETIRKVVRSVMVMLEGRNDGTGINQMSQRITDMIEKSYPKANRDKYRESKSQDNFMSPKISRDREIVSISKEQFNIIDSTIGWTPASVEMGVVLKINLKNSPLRDELPTILNCKSVINEDLVRVPLWPMVTWIVKTYLMPSSSNIGYASISRYMEDRINSIKVDVPKIPKGFLTEIAMVAIALRCILHRGCTKCIGSECEPSFTVENLSYILPPIITQNLDNDMGRVAIMGPPGCGKTWLSNILRKSNLDVIDCEGTIGEWDTKLEMHKIDMENIKVCKVVIPCYDEAWMKAFRKASESSRVKFKAMVLVEDDDPSSDDVRIKVRFENSHPILNEELVESVRFACKSGFSMNDRNIESILFSTIKDVLGLTYPDVKEVHRRHRNLRSSGKYGGNLVYAKEMLNAANRISDTSEARDVFLAIAMRHELERFLNTANN